MSDSALYLCAVQDTLVPGHVMKEVHDMVLIFLAALVEMTDFGHAQKDSVLQFPAEMTIQVGHSTALHCNFSTSFSDLYIFWYQQHQNQPPQMLLWGNYQCWEEPLFP
ncbi:putative LOC102084667 [Columba livia]|uniref:Putative LOC102084667 n=1 Tax=Columba livia TaxID=8932 RepID=A0A2I0LN48_COLLI|nr:putative LOC102084667 [Columba livia]